MGTFAVSIIAAPVGVLETSGDGSSPDQAQMDEETRARDSFLALIAPYLQALPDRPPRRMGNVSRAELLGRGVWSELNHYLLLLEVDIGDPGTEDDLIALLPGGSRVTTIGADFDSLKVWPDGSPAAG